MVKLVMHCCKDILRTREYAHACKTSTMNVSSFCRNGFDKLESPDLNVLVRLDKKVTVRDALARKIFYAIHDVMHANNKIVKINN